MDKRLELAKRNSSGKEQYYTRPEIVAQCVQVAAPYMENYKILEPSAGTGEFLKALVDHDVVALDIEPKHPQVIQQDFFEFTTDETFFTIGNPPFGRNHSLSTRFFNHAANFSDYIGFIIPKSWRKWSVQNRLDMRFHLIEDIELPKDIFYDSDGSGFGSNFNAVFQVWQKQSNSRTKITIEDRNYVTKVSPSEANVALVYAGYSAGRVETEFAPVPNTTKIYLRASQEVIEALNQIDYSKLTENCAFTPVFGLEEVKHELNKYFDK